MTIIFDTVITLADLWKHGPQGWFQDCKKPLVNRLRHDLRMRVDPELERILRRMEASHDIQELMEWWNCFYDWADLNRVRVITC